MIVAIAWRNLWRNPRRTAITLLAVAGSLASLLAMYAMVRAMGDRLLEGLTGSFMGHVQLHDEGYRDRQSATLTVPQADLVLAAVRRSPGVAAAAGRIYGFAHASVVRGEDDAVRAGGGEDVASPVLALLGVEPEDESRVTDLADKVQSGRWLAGRTDVVLGHGLATRHGVEVGDAFLPTAIDLHGAMRGPWAVSDEVPRVSGIMRSGVEQLDSRMALMDRTYLAELLRMDDQVHEVVVRAEQPKQLDPLVEAIRRSVAEALGGADSGAALHASAPLATARVGRGRLEAAPEPGAAGAGADAGPAEPVPIRLVGVSVGQGGEPGARDLAPGLEGRTLLRAEDLVLARPAAEALGAAIGDRVEVQVPVECGEELPEEACPPAAEPFVVVGVVDEPDLLGGRFGLVAEQVLAGNVAALAPGAISPLEGDEGRAALELAGRLRGAEGAPVEVAAWYEIAPALQEMLAMMDVGTLIMFLIVYFAVVLGIVNTMLMATFERTRELGLMRALGLPPLKVVSMVMWESTLLAAVGVVFGLAIGMPLVWYWHTHGMNFGVFMAEDQSFDLAGVVMDPVLWPSIRLGDVVASVLAIGAMTALAGLWPAIRAARLRPTDALRAE